MEDLLRRLAPQVLGVVTRLCGDFDDAEDAVQEALLAASTQWPADGLPDNQQGWLIAVAARRMTDRVRNEEARRRREDLAAIREPVDRTPTVSEYDDSLVLLFMCCHPALTPASAIPLTLRAVGGLTTAEIARAFLIPEATMAQRISRAKQRIKASGVPFARPAAGETAERLRSVLHVLYLMFTEGHAATSGAGVARGDLSVEAIRLARMVHRLLPDEPEVAGLLAMMLLNEARRPARTGPAGELVPLAAQDRSRWNRALIALYGLLERMTANPMVTLNRAVATAMVDGPAAGLALLADLDDQLPGHHRLDAVRAHLLEMTGDREAAVAHYRTAAARTTSIAERDYLTTQAARLHTGPP
ncbi:MAG TPA: sigma-70 family RNA polymerase sigma factor [Baekduia sp.]|uniref:RNA polymerase sigma factor n=1 Tax=Baekduia sp. TaxID=2600305 RepID=UPI002C1C1015|nr:sigma-70 family RNA polymerase sigma factor [Baekduia sp.]HMJ37295.1 sigma-70 family RNA polymerase sigma factor [Baekduia sp.]